MDMSTAAPLPLLSPETLAEALNGPLDQWRSDGSCLRRSYRTKDWTSAVMAANAVAHLAELAWHHPELHVAWGHLDIMLTSHEVAGQSQPGLTAKDVSLALKIEQTLGWDP